MLFCASFPSIAHHTGSFVHVSNGALELMCFALSVDLPRSSHVRIAECANAVGTKECFKAGKIMDQMETKKYGDVN